ncbi:hypothetical protein K438DRAFT_1883156 [Mycena galopus ATCC 62051]|nr:hypothetical protein K438DRAFT_1883156 [Mycena galopus ATCC 62051]
MPSKLKSVLARWLRRGGTGPAPLPPLDPTPLPMNRIDIHEKPLAEQPQNLLLKLPLELREYIYDVALGGRWISMGAVNPVSIPGKQGRSVVRSTCYEAVDDAEDVRCMDSTTCYLGSTATKAKIPIALLLTCRQVYLEALPTLHQRNMFLFPACNFDGLFFAALGRHCLPHIRHLNVYVPYQYGCTYDLDAPGTWRTVFWVLREMRLQSLALGFKDPLAASGPFENSDSIFETVWAHDILKIRGLRCFRLGVKFVDGVPPTLGPEIEQKFQQLMIGSGADERYEVFMKKWKSGKKAERTEAEVAV